MMFHYDYPRAEDSWFYPKEHKGKHLFNKKIISLNGLGRAGKTTQSLKLSKSNLGIPCIMYALRDRFFKDFYSILQRTEDQGKAEVLGMPSIAWLAAEFHWRVKPLLNSGKTVIMDHYIADFYADMLPDCDDVGAFLAFVRLMKMPDFGIGKHFYIDIPYAEYLKRSNREDLVGGEKLKGETVVRESSFKGRRKRYMELVDGGHLIYIDGCKDEQDVFEDITRGIE